MAKSKAEHLVTQSLMDRLCDVDDWPMTRQQSMRVYRESVKRDVELLLNARRPPMPYLAKYPKASGSVMNFGLPDMNAYGSSNADQNALMIAILQTIRNFEPRIQNVKVYMVRQETVSRSLRFHVEGKLRFGTTIEDIQFDTVLELTRGEYEVK